MPLASHSLIKELYPSLKDNHIENLSNALCPFKVKLPLHLKETIKKTCSDFLKLKKESHNKWEDSILNSLDFHYSNEKLKIIEANTNASGYMISHLLEQNRSALENFEQDLFSSFKKIFGPKFKKVFIIDADPEKEKMFAEFLMYKDFFTRFDVEANIIRTSDLKNYLEDKTYVYNRDTDFYFEHHPELLQSWKDGNLLLTSSPLSYGNIAAKSVTSKEIELLQSPAYKSLQEHSLQTKAFNKDMWSERKNFFFKPASSFGSKGVYSGKSISRKKFDGLDDTQGYLAQEVHPPGKLVHESTEWKYDLRAYFSEGDVQKVLARVYQGQLTNFSQSGGGFALIDWIV